MPVLSSCWSLAAYAQSFFPCGESSRKLAPHPFILFRLFTNRTVLSGCAIRFFYFCKLSILPVQLTNLKHSELLFASSGFLYLYPALLLLLPASCAKRLRHHCWPHYANLYLHVHGSRYHHINYNQIHSPLQILHHRWCCDIPPWHRLMIRYRVEGSSTSQIVGTQIANANCGWHRCWYAQRACTTGCSRICQPR